MFPFSSPLAFLASRFFFCFLNIGARGANIKVEVPTSYPRYVRWSRLFAFEVRTSSTQEWAVGRVRGETRSTPCSTSGMMNSKRASSKNRADEKVYV